MRTKQVVKEFYQLISDNVESCLQEDEQASNIRNSKHILLILSITDFTVIAAFVKRAQEINPNIRITYIGQKDSIDMICEWLGVDIENIEWSRRFDEEIIEEIMERVEISTVGGVYYLSHVKQNIRDINLIDIGMKLQEHMEIPTYCFVKAERIYEIMDLEQYQSNLMCFEALTKWVHYNIL